MEEMTVGPATVVAHSSGSLVAMEPAQARPDLVRRLALCEPPLLDPADVADVHATVGPGVGSAVTTG